MKLKDYFKNWVAVGGDLGPLRTIENVIYKTSCQQIYYDNVSRKKKLDYWIRYLKKNNIKGIICGTSLTYKGFRFEAKFRIAAYRLGLYIICIEDFPGNYRDINQVKTSLLVKDSVSYKKKNKNYVFIEKIIKCPNIRFDFLRPINLNKSIQKKSSVYNILWIGQPEYSFNLRTLKIILPKIKELPVNFFFRAHPKDPGYKLGLYNIYFNQELSFWYDISNHPIDENLFKQISLVITQFSSLGIEAGFYGVPTVFLLFEKIGEKLLYKRTGSKNFFLVDKKGAFVIRDKNLLSNIDEFLNNKSLRNNVIKNFATLYKAHEKQLPNLFGKIQAIIQIK